MARAPLAQHTLVWQYSTLLIYCKNKDRGFGAHSMDATGPAPGDYPPGASISSPRSLQPAGAGFGKSFAPGARTLYISTPSSW